MFPSTTLSYTSITRLIDTSKGYLMDSDPIYPRSSPAAVDAFEIPFPRRFLSYEVDGTDDKVSPNGRDGDTSRGKSTKPRVNLTVTNIICRPTELPPALWAPDNNTPGPGTIRLPPKPFHTPTKRKHHEQSPDPYRTTLSISSTPELPAKRWRPKDFEQETSSELEIFAQSAPLPKGKLKCRPRSSEIPGASPKHRGRPHKVPMDPQSCDFSAHVYIEIANPPKLHRGKTHRTNKYVPQGPTTEGPFTFTHQMSWRSFLSQVAELAELEEDNIVLTQMTWHFQGKARSLPLANIGGFTAMVMQIRALKAGVSAIIMLGLPVPPAKPSRGGHNASAVTEDALAHDTGPGSGENCEAMWGKKVYSSRILMACTQVYALTAQSR
jgi:hypothetical protein